MFFGGVGGNFYFTFAFGIVYFSFTTIIYSLI